MTRDELIIHLNSLPHAEETYPFDEVTMVFKIGGKMFALLSSAASHDLTINLKNKPETNLFLRDMYDAIVPGYHMNKAHWNTITLGLDVPNDVVLTLIQESYDIVYKSLTKKIKETLK